MKLIVDRVEGELAGCETEDRTMIQIPVTEFESLPKDGDVVCYENHCAKKLEAETLSRKQAADELFRSLLKKQR